MKLITRYILREHLGPFTFALTALTSLMLLNFISRQFGDLVGKGLPWKVIGEFFLLSVPFTVALTVPMSVLVAVLYAFSRLAAENEVTALKANGVSPWRLVAPAIVGGVVMSIGLLAFNDQVLPRANHRLKTLQDDISQTKPTLLLKEQVVNAIAEGKFYLKADKIDQSHGKLKKAVIYDHTDPTRRRTIYADSGRITFAANRVDLNLDLFVGEMQEVTTDKPTQLDRLFYKKDRIRIRDIGQEFKQHGPDSLSKGDREMSICEMQRRLWAAESNYAAAERDVVEAKKVRVNYSAFPVRTRVGEPRGIGWAYCALLRSLPSVRAAHAAEIRDAGLHRVSHTVTNGQEPVKPQAAQVGGTFQDTTTQKKLQDTTTLKKKKAPAPTVLQFDRGKLVGEAPPGQLTPVPGAIRSRPITPVPSAAGAGAGTVVPPQPGAVPGAHPGVAQPPAPPAPAAPQQTPAEIAARAAAEVMRSGRSGLNAGGSVEMNSRVSEATLRLEIAERMRDRYAIEIHKKFSLAAACLIFCIVAPPIALRFPRGGVGLVISVSLAVFALYYVGLIGGESLANIGLVPPFWAMWGTNVILTLGGVVMLLRMGRDAGAGRGGGWREWLDERRLLRDERRAASAFTRAE